MVTSKANSTTPALEAGGRYKSKGKGFNTEHTEEKRRAQRKTRFTAEGAERSNCSCDGKASATAARFDGTEPAATNSNARGNGKFKVARLKAAATKSKSTEPAGRRRYRRQRLRTGGGYEADAAGFFAGGGGDWGWGFGARRFGGGAGARAG